MFRTYSRAWAEVDHYVAASYLLNSLRLVRHGLSLSFFFDLSTPRVLAEVVILWLLHIWVEGLVCIVTSLVLCDQHLYVANFVVTFIAQMFWLMFIR